MSLVPKNYWSIFNSSYRQWKGSSRKIYNIKLAYVKASVFWSKARNQKQRTLLVFGNEITEIKRLCSSDHVPSITKQWALINKKNKNNWRKQTHTRTYSRNCFHGDDSERKHNFFCLELLALCCSMSCAIFVYGVFLMFFFHACCSFFIVIIRVNQLFYLTKLRWFFLSPENCECLAV